MIVQVWLVRTQGSVFDRMLLSTTRSWPSTCTRNPSPVDQVSVILFSIFPPLHFGRIMTCQCFRSSAISVVIWFLVISSSTRSRHLSFGLPRSCFPSTVTCNIFLMASSLSHLCTRPNHLNLSAVRSSAIGSVCLFPDVYISHMISHIDKRKCGVQSTGVPQNFRNNEYII